MDTDTIKKFLNSGAGIGMRDYLQAKLDDLDSINNIKEKDTPTHQAIEMKAQKRAYDILKVILGEIMTLSETVKSKDPKDSYAVGVE